MCGIAGFFYINSERKPEEKIIKEMTGAMFHRGPDAAGYFVDDRIALGHRRLSIIDLTEAANQPVSSEDGNVWVVFNGEVYNFRELRDVLKRKGHVFRSRGDSEVIVHAYEEWGERCFEYLDGMLACAIYDKGQGRLLLARDRFGKKPLYYTLQNGVFAFASEIKALKKHPELMFQFDTISVARYFVYDYVPGPQTIFNRVYRLDPGSYVVIDLLDDRPGGGGEGPFDTVRYWELKFVPKLDISIDEAKKRLKELLLRAVEKRLISDVPLGVFLSGGIDSSTILWAVVEIIGAKNVDAFSVGFKEKSYDESEYAKRVADYFGVNFYSRVFGLKDLLEIFDDVVTMLDEPFADYSIFPTYLLSKFAREYITVALSGDGGDEFLAGYDPFVALKLSRVVDLLPLPLIDFFRVAGNLFPVSENNMSPGFRLRRFLNGFLPGIDRNYLLRNQVWLGSFNYKNLPMANGYGRIDILYEKLSDIENRELDCIDALINAYARTYLVDDILYKVDRASMFNSLEVRCPFLDKDLVEFLLRLPSHHKMRGLKTKCVLKEAVRGVLPEFVVRRPKKGFGIPVAGWIKKDLKKTLLKNLQKLEFLEAFQMDRSRLRKLARQCDRGDVRNWKELWSLLMIGEVVEAGA